MMQARKKMKTWLLLICLILINTHASIASGLNSHNLPPVSAFQPIIDDLNVRFPKSPKDPLIVVSASEQRLFFIKDDQVAKAYTISTAEAGLGNRMHSNKTPLGVHRVAQKIGAGAKPGTIFKARANTRRIARILNEPGTRSNADNVTSRILWLSGMEKGINKGGKVDSQARYIYIHGTDEEGRLGTPASHGCIRMANNAVIELFEEVPVGTLVTIIK